MYNQSNYHLYLLYARTLKKRFSYNYKKKKLKKDTSKDKGYVRKHQNPKVVLSLEPMAKNECKE